jgi:fructokinase
MSLPAQDTAAHAESPTFVVAGESLVDIVVPADGSGRHDAVGGSCLNVAVGLARLDVPTTLATRLGDDELGRLVLEHVRQSRVALAPGSVVPGAATSTATAHLDDDHAATYDFEIEWDLPSASLSPATAGLHVGSLGTTLEPGRTAVARLVHEAADADVFVSYDPNVRAPLVADPVQAWRDIEALAGRAHLVKLSDQDVEVLHPGADPEDIARSLLQGDRTELVVLTRGGDGALAFFADLVVRVPAAEVDVVDTVGAGDAFMAATLAVLLEGSAFGSYGAGVPSDPERVEQMLRAAVEVAGITCSRPGAAAPTRPELRSDWPA